MQTCRKFVINAVLVLGGLIFATQAFSKGAEFKFDSTVASISTSGVDSGTFTVEFTDFQVPVIVNGDTEITEGGSEITISELMAGDSIRIEAFFSDAGITAEEIFVLESSGEQFRLNGVITEIIPDVEVPAGSSSLYTQISLLGVDVFADESVLLTGKGTTAASTMQLADFEAGDQIDVYGYFDEALFVERIGTGVRQNGQFELDGVVVEIPDENTLLIELEDGGQITVVITDDSELSGEITLGAFVEVEGMLNADLAIEAHELVVDADNDGDADDDHDRARHGGDPDVIGNPNSSTVTAVLSAADSGDSSATGEISVSIAPNGQEVEVEISGASPNTVHTVHILVAGVAIELGTLETDEEGEAELDLDSIGNSPGSLPLPSGTSVDELTDVEVSVDGTIVLSGTFG